MREQKRGGGKGKEKRSCLSVERVRNVCRNECIVLELGDTLEIKVRERRSFARHGCVLLRSAALCYFATRRDVLYSLSQRATTWRTTKTAIAALSRAVADKLRCIQRSGLSRSLSLSQGPSASLSPLSFSFSLSLCLSVGRTVCLKRSTNVGQSAWCSTASRSASCCKTNDPETERSAI